MTQIKSLQTGIKFKDTPVGKIPVDWEVIQLVKVASLEYGASLPERERVKGTIPVYGSNGAVGYHNKKLLDGPGIIIGRKGTVGAVTWAEKNFWPIDTTYYISEKQCNEHLKWLFYLLSSLHLEKLNTATGIPGLNRNAAYSLNIPLPPFPEQKKIAEILTTVDDAIEEADRIIEKTKELKKGLLQKLLTRGIGHKKFKKTEIGEIPVEWEVVRLKEIANVRYGLGQPPALDDNGIPMVRATNIHEGAISRVGLISVKRDAIPPSRNPFLKEGEIIVVRSGAYTGDIGLITTEWEGAVAGYDLVITPSKKLDSVFLTNYLLSSFIQKGYFASLRERSAQPHLNSLQVEETPIVLPSPSEQKRIADILGIADSEAKKEEFQKQYLETLKKSLMQVLLTGRVRVRVH